MEATNLIQLTMDHTIQYDATSYHNLFLPCDLTLVNIQYDVTILKTYHVSCHYITSLHAHLHVISCIMSCFMLYHVLCHCIKSCIASYIYYVIHAVGGVVLTFRTAFMIIVSSGSSMSSIPIMQTLCKIRIINFILPFLLNVGNLTNLGARLWLYVPLYATWLVTSRNPTKCGS